MKSKLLEKIKEKKKNTFMNKRGQIFSQLSDLAIGVLVLAVVLIVVFLFLADLGSNSDVLADANATAAVNTLTSAAADIPGWVGLIVLAFIAVVILGLVQLFRRSG